MTGTTRVLQAAQGGHVDPEALVSALSGHYAVVAGPEQVVGCARLDTFDRRLRAAGLELEHRRLSDREQLVLRGPDGTTAMAAPPSGLRWPALAEALPPGPLRTAVAPVIGIRALMVTSDEARRLRSLGLQNDDGKTLARVEVDEPASAPGAPGAPGAPARVQVRALRGYEKQARLAAGLLEGVGLHVVENARAGEPAASESMSAVDRDTPAVVLLATALGQFLTTIRENLPGLLDDVDTEFLHDFRVAVRRTRATLRLGRPVLTQVMRERWEPAFKELGDITTPLRDLDVYELDLPTMSGWLEAADPSDLDPLAAHLRRRRTAQRRTLVRRLRSAGFGRLLTEWDHELARLTDDEVESGQQHISAGQLADRSITKAYRRVTRDGAAIRGDSPAEHLHELRKQCKHLRYALEVFAPVVDKGPRRRAVADLKGLQDVLGRFQDAQVQREALRGFAEEMMASGTSAGSVLAMGELVAHLDAQQHLARKDFDDEFARFARPANQQMMHRLGGRR